MSDLFLEILQDSFKVFIVAFVIYLVVSFFEEKIENLLKKHHKMSPLLGALTGLVPQCGFSVVSANLYSNNKISFGTLIAVFIACSDESIPLLLTNGAKAIYVLPLLVIKLLLGFLIGLIINIIIYRKLNKAEIIDDQTKYQHNHEYLQENFFQKHFLHPLIHTLRIFLYVLVINLLFGILVYYVGEDNIINFLQSNKDFGPLFSSFIGLIPTCASSVIISELYLIDGLSFGSLIAGLITNAGFGIFYLFRSKKHIKDGLLAIGILLITAIISGYTLHFFNLFN